MNKLNYELLHIFNIVSQFSSFNQASNYLYLDQSTVSKKIKQLETIVNQKLFIRNTDGIVLTAAGIAFKNKSDKILRDLNEITTFKPTITNLRIGVFDNISAYLMPTFFAKNFNKFKELKISSKGVELVNLFNEGKLDAVFINNDLFTQIQGFVIESQIADESFAVIFNKNNASITNKNSISLTDLKNKNIILAPNYCPVNSKLHRIINSFNDYIELDYVDSMINFILASNYLTILPISMAKQLSNQINSLDFIELSDLPKRQISLFTREENISQVLTSLAKNA